jgi:hypothetical protein
VQAGTGAAAGLFGQLERDEAGGDDVIAPDHALVLDAEDLVEIDRLAARLPCKQEEVNLR